MTPALDAAGQAIFWVAIAAIMATLAGGIVYLTGDKREERIWADAESGHPDLADAPDTGWQPTGRLAAWTKASTARVMADPVTARLSVLGRQLADMGRAQPRLECGHPADMLCACAALIVSGPAPAPPRPSPPSPPAAAAGPETPDLDQLRAFVEASIRANPNPAPIAYITTHPVTSGAPNHRAAATGVTSLPPVDQAAHLQPIGWRDATGSFRAICEEGQ